MKMTNQQRRYIYVLYKQLGIPTNRPVTCHSKGEASNHIRNLLKRINKAKATK